MWLSMTLVCGIEVERPDIFEQHRPRDDLARVRHQIFEQLELLRLQLDPLASARHRALEQVELKVGDLPPGDDRRGRGRRPAH